MKGLRGLAYEERLSALKLSGLNTHRITNGKMKLRDSTVLKKSRIKGILFCTAPVGRENP